MERLVQQLTHLGYFKPVFDIFGHSLQPGDEVRFDGYAVTCMAANHNVPAYSYCLEEDSRPGRFNKQRALELGVPEGPLFGRLQNGHSVEIDGATITPDMVLGRPRPGRKVTLSGDTAPYDGFIEFARGSNVLIHEATADSSLEEKANEYGHSSARQAAEVAAAADVDRLYLTHVSPRYRDVSEVEAEAREVFPETTVAHDFLQVEVELKK
jgi:ribonuclease Z